jgi:hypothetical protein
VLFDLLRPNCRHIVFRFQLITTFVFKRHYRKKTIRLHLVKKILLHVYPLLCNDSVNKFPQHTRMRHPLLGNGAINTSPEQQKTAFSLGSVPRGYKGYSRSTDGIPNSSRENWIEFWRWQSKVIKKKWQERN